jgi:predicted HicB family RNase H-like nuclease
VSATLANRERRFEKDLHIRTPPELLTAVTLAADKNFITPSEYIRQAIMDRLRQDRLDPRNASEAA